MIKLIATDMDGTFLDSKKRISPEFIDIFYELRKRDIYFVVASGNQYYRLYQKFLPMSNQMYFIGENGSFIAKGCKVLKTNTIKPQTLKVLLKKIEQFDGLEIVLAGVKSAYCLKSVKHLDKVIGLYYCNYQFVDSFDKIDDEIMKIAVYDPQAKISRFVDDIAKATNQGLKATTSGNEWIDIQNDDINKGIAIRYLQKELKISPDECMAFGDQMNDYALLSSVKYSYAMANAVMPIKDIAYGQALSNDEYGVIKVIKEEVLQKES